MFHSAPRPRRVGGLIVALALLAASPAALAAKKKAAAAPPADEPAASGGDTKLTPPPPDAFGRVHFGPPSAPDLGRVTVKAPASDKVQVFLEGRYFGDAPLTIYSVPKGDYIVEGTYPDGKSISRPVSVIENDEAVADLTGARAAEAKAKEKPIFETKEISPGRLTATKVFVIGGSAALVAGIVFGVLEMRKENEYKTAPNNPDQLSSIANTGKTYALAANVGFAVAFVGLAGAAVCAYPMFMHPAAEKKMASADPVFVVVPASGGLNGAMSLRF